MAQWPNGCSVLQVLPELRPTRFKSDYERAAINGIQRAYPGITTEGDSFHMAQAFMKRMRSLGLAEQYGADVELFHQVGTSNASWSGGLATNGGVEFQIRLMLTIMFVPRRDVVNYWHDVVKPLITYEELEPIVAYAERNWIG